MSFILISAAQHAYVLASDANEANSYHDGSVGHYEQVNEKHNNATAWKKDSKEHIRYLYKYDDGRWYISDSLGLDVANMKTKTPSDSPFAPGLQWEYIASRTYSGGTWTYTYADDDTIHAALLFGEFNKYTCIP